MPEQFLIRPEFNRRGGELFCEDVSLAKLAREFGTPLYVYSRGALEAAADDWLAGCDGVRHEVFYAVKANSGRAILELFARRGLGFDIVSGGELLRASLAGGGTRKIVYSGVGKLPWEISLAIEKGIRCFNAESIPELYRLQEVAQASGAVIDVAVRINPDVDAKTHPAISTGLKTNKFGVAWESVTEAFEIAARLPNLHVSGIDCHIGSQITSVDPFVHAAEKVIEVVKELALRGIPLDHIDFGGGLGVSYGVAKPPRAQELVTVLGRTCREAELGGLTLFFEPGRSLVAESCVLLTEVQFIKTGAKNFCIVDAGMNDMIRPALYQAEMPITSCTERHGEPLPCDIVGPVCESDDFLGMRRTIAAEPGDILAMTGAGAYGMSMASTYNSRPRPAEVMVDGDRAYLIREREKVEDLTRGELPLACD